MVYQPAEKTGCHLRTREIGPEIVSFGEGLEGTITNIPDRCGIPRLGPAQINRQITPSRLDRHLPADGLFRARRWQTHNSRFLLPLGH
jgi:hypothetical protein